MSVRTDMESMLLLLLELMVFDGLYVANCGTLVQKQILVRSWFVFALLPPNEEKKGTFFMFVYTEINIYRCNDDDSRVELNVSLLAVAEEAAGTVAVAH